MRKNELIALAKELLECEDLSQREKDLLFLKREYARISSREEDSFLEQELNNEFISLFNELAKKEPSLTRSPAEERKKIIQLTKELMNREDIIKASKDLNTYTEAFKKAGRSSKEQDDQLWAEFKEARNEFFNKKEAYFASLSENYENKKKQKEEIIVKAKELLELKNYKEANEKLDALMEEWKQVGFAGKANDQLLWEQFSKVRKEFFAKRKEHYKEMEKVFIERVTKKEEMILQAKKLLADSSFSKEEVEKIKSMRAEFNKIGFAGKEKDEDLYQRFTDIVNKYFEEKKYYGE